MLIQILVAAATVAATLGAAYWQISTMKRLAARRRKKPEAPRPHKMLFAPLYVLYVFLPLVGVLSAFALIAIAHSSAPLTRETVVSAAAWAAINAIAFAGFVMTLLLSMLRESVESTFSALEGLMESLRDAFRRDSAV